MLTVALYLARRIARQAAVRRPRSMRVSWPRSRDECLARARRSSNNWLRNEPADRGVVDRFAGSARVGDVAPLAQAGRRSRLRDRGPDATRAGRSAARSGSQPGSIIEHGISKHLVILSDDAGQFNVLLHALCWIHANRAIDKIIPFTDQAEKDLDTVKDQVWLLYEGLKAVQAKPQAKR